VDIATAYRVCEQITRAEASNFAYGIRLLPARKRRALSAIYAMSRRIDDIGDGTLPDEEKLRRLDEVRADLHGSGADTDDAVLVALADASARLPIPLDAFDDLIDGVEMDARRLIYATFDEVVVYCRRVAGSIGRLSLGVFEPRDMARAKPLADDLGVALQLTNILRDVREDLLRGRVYVPREDLRRFGVELRLDAPSDGAFEALIRFEADRAIAWFERGLQLLPLLDLRSAACAGTMARIYRRLLDRIRRDPSEVMRRRVSLPLWEKALVAARGFVRA
jgi:phytoene synthase